MFTVKTARGTIEATSNSRKQSVDYLNHHNFFYIEYDEDKDCEVFEDSWGIKRYLYED